MSLRLKIEHGQDAGHTWRLQQPGLYVIGRDATSSIRVLDMKVSKGHCEIGLSNGSEGAAWIRDLKSTHGTQLNGQPLAREAPVKPGDEIRLGFTVLRLLSDGPADTVAAPSGPLPPPAPKAPAQVPANGAGGAAPAPGAPGTPANVTAPWAKDSQAAGAPASDAGKPVSKTLPPDELVGQTLGGYHVLRKIGQGGMGSVYVAEQVSLKREVALKVLSEKFVADSAFVDQFLNEARAAGQLNHPNVVQVYDVGQVGGRYFFSMEFVPGGAIEDRVKGGKSAEWSEALNWFLDATNALIFAQKRGILHRDVKPDNLMLAEDGSAKLCDLGLAKKSESADLLAQGIIGTPHYLSPETIRRKGDIDHRTDLYSLGCTFYRILAGENPYPAKTVKDILLGHLNKPVPRVTDKKADVPKDLSDAVFKLMQKEPADRYASADDLYNALDKIRIQHGLAAHGIKPGSKKPLVIALIVALLAAGALVWVVARPTKAPELTQEQKDQIARDRKEREDADRLRKETERRNFFLGAGNSIGDLELRARTQDPEKSWANEAAWKAFFDDVQKVKGELESHKEYADDEEMKTLLERLEKLVADTTKDLGFHKQNAATIKQATETFAKNLTETLDGHRKMYDALMAPPEGQVLRWWDAAALMTRDAISELLKPLMDRQRITIGSRQIELMRDRAFDEQARKALPGQDRIGQQLYEDAIKAGEKAHAAALQALGTPKGDAPKDLEAAVQELEKYRDALPDPGGERTDEIAEVLRKHRAAVEKRSTELREKALEFLEKDRAADRVTLHKLIQMLWEPRRGALAVFRWIPDDEVRRLAEALKDPAYRRRGAEELADFQAFTKLFANLKMAFETKTWVDLNLEGPDGKPQKVTDVTAEGITCPAKTPRIWVDLTAPYLLSKVFYVKPDQPRYPFTAEDLRGLAVLAEMAGDEAQAAQHWQKYQAALPAEQADLKAGVALHLAELPRSMQVARRWNEMNEHLRAIEEFGAKNALPQPGPGATITPEQRDAIRREKAAIHDHWNEAGQIFVELHMNAEFAATRWGAAIRAETHPRAAFTGESIPASVPMPPPLPIVAPPAPPPAPLPVPGDNGKKPG